MKMRLESLVRSARQRYGAWAAIFILFAALCTLSVFSARDAREAAADPAKAESDSSVYYSPNDAASQGTDSVLGVVWSVLNPLLMCLVYWAVFSSLMDMRGSGIDNFPVFLMCGQLLFNFFNEATSSSMSSVLSAAPLLKKVYIPKYIFPLEKCCFAMVNCVFSFVALALVMVFTGSPLHWTILEVIYPLVTLFFFSLGVGLFLAAATVFFRDIMHIWSVFVTALLYFSAIFYDPTQMTFSIGGFNMQQIIKLNPMYWYITGFRRTLMWGIPLDFNMLAVCGVCALLSMLVGVQMFRKTQDRFVLHI